MTQQELLAREAEWDQVEARAVDWFLQNSYNNRPTMDKLSGHLKKHGRNIAVAQDLDQAVLALAEFAFRFLAIRAARKDTDLRAERDR